MRFEDFAAAILNIIVFRGVSETSVDMYQAEWRQFPAGSNLKKKNSLTRTSSSNTGNQDPCSSLQFA
jgi:hypothetical protein